MPSFPKWCWLFVLGTASCAAGESATAQSWPQFRGPNASGIAQGRQPLPAEIAPDKNLLWQVPMGSGYSSPVVAGERVFVTAYRQKKLLTLAIDTRSGTTLWEAEAPYEKLEKIGGTGSYATPSPATDGTLVVSFFGSCGLFCYDLDGRQKWHVPMGPFRNEFGAAASPILVGDLVISLQDHDLGSFLAAFDKQTGREVWRVDRPNFRRSYCTPIVWQVDGGPQIVVAGSSQIVAYDAQTGNYLWTVRGVARVVNSTPIVGEDGILYLANTGGGETQQPSFKQIAAQADANRNGMLEESELPGSPIKGFFGQFDRNADGSLSEEEYDSIREIFSLSRTVAMAIRPGGTGDITDTHVVWTQTRSIPRNASPLYSRGYLFLVNDGGIVASLDAKTGEIIKQGRVSGTGKYFSSPVAGDGKIYMGSDRGELCVITAEPEWDELAEAEFPAGIYASPAIANGQILLRTEEALYCFRASSAGNPEGDR